MKQITRREAIEAIKGMFETETGREDNISRFFEEADDTATFMIDKRKYEREEIITKLSDYFDGVNIKDGQCRIGDFTFVFTIVKIEKRSDNKENLN